MLTCYRRTALGLILAGAVTTSSLFAAAERPLGSLESGMNDLIFRLSRSVVTVENYRHLTSTTYGASETVENLVSSGIIVDTLGHILVSANAVAGHDRLSVNFENHRYPAKLVAVDYVDDLALIRASKPLGVPARVSEKRVCAGQMVVALGNAYGLRACPAIGFCAGIRPDGYVQFSVSINPSALGGGIFDLTGNLLGMAINIMGEGSGVTVAVPAHQLPVLVQHLLTTGDRQAGYIGISSADFEVLPGLELETSGPAPSAIPVNTGGTAAGWSTIERGVVVTYVSGGSPAERAGLIEGDLIVGFRGQRINTAMDLAQIVKYSPPGSLIGLDFVRQNRLMHTQIQIGKKSLARPVITAPAQPYTELSADSLAKLVTYLKQEVTRLEQRVKRVR